MSILGPLHLYNPHAAPTVGPLVLEKTVRVMGLDFGQSGDPSAAAVLEVRKYHSSFVGPRYDKRRFLNLRRWALGTDYCRVIDDVLAVEGIDHLVCDYGGVGRPCVDILLRQARKVGWQGHLHPVVLLGSNARGQLKVGERVAHRTVNKLDVVGALQVAQQQKLLVLPRCSETTVLLDEMRRFQMKATKAGNLQTGAVTDNDDLVIAVGLACWWVHRFGKGEAALVC